MRSGVYFQPAGKSGADGLFQSRPCGIPGIAAKDDDPRCLSAAGVPVCVLMVNLVNTLMTNLLARQQELGILQSVGMTGKQVSRMLIAECLWYAGVTVFLSVGIGGILGWIFDYVISSFNIFGELSYQFPLMETVVFVLALLVVTGIFSVVAVRYSKRLSLVERIKTMD